MLLLLHTIALIPGGPLCCLLSMTSGDKELKEAEYVWDTQGEEDVGVQCHPSQQGHGEADTKRVPCPVRCHNVKLPQAQHLCRHLLLLVG